MQSTQQFRQVWCLYTRRLWRVGVPVAVVNRWRSFRCSLICLQLIYLRQAVNGILRESITPVNCDTSQRDSALQSKCYNYVYHLTLDNYCCKRKSPLWAGAGNTLSESTHYCDGQSTDKEQKGWEEKATIKDRTTWGGAGRRRNGRTGKQKKIRKGSPRR